MIDLNKGEDGEEVNPAGRGLDLTKEDGAPVTSVTVSLTWQAKTTSGPKYDPDVVAFALGDDDKICADDEFYSWFIRAFGKNEAAKNLISPDGAIMHGGDDTSGDMGGEKLVVDATKLSSLVASVRVSVTIFQAKARKHNFGLIKKCRITVTDNDTGATLVTGELSFDNSADNAINALDLIPRNGGLFVRYLGEGYEGGLAGICGDHNVKVGKNDYDDPPTAR